MRAFICKSGGLGARREGWFYGGVVKRCIATHRTNVIYTGGVTYANNQFCWVNLWSPPFVPSFRTPEFHFALPDTLAMAECSSNRRIIPVHIATTSFISGSQRNEMTPGPIPFGICICSFNRNHTTYLWRFPNMTYLPNFTLLNWRGFKRIYATGVACQ